MIDDRNPYGCYCNHGCNCYHNITKVSYTDSRIIKITELINSWIAKHSHESCWYYPDIFAQICTELGIEWKQPELPPRSEFEKGCCKFQDELYGKKNEKPRCEICNDTLTVTTKDGETEFCWCYYAGGRVD